MIKKSNDLFQILYGIYLATEYQRYKIKEIKDEKNKNPKIPKIPDNSIIDHLEKFLNNNFVLEETIFYLFEKNSMIFIENYLNKIDEKEENQKKLDDEELLDIFKECINSLEVYIGNSDKKNSKFNSKLKEHSKLFCISYIKTYIYTFINMFKDEIPKWDDPENIIKIFNEDNNTCNMIRIYIYKILYNKYKIDFFLDDNNISKYHLDEYTNYEDFIKIEELSNLYKLDYKIKTINDDKFSDISSKIERFKKNEFKTKIRERDIDIKQIGIDNFYMASHNIILLNSQLKKEDINKNFYENICKVLFADKPLLLKAIKLFFDPEKFEEIKNKCKINANNITQFLFGYRFCINTLFNENEKGIYYPLYSSDIKNYIKERYYPGNDTKVNLVFSKIVNHFKNKPEEGCYLCLCKEWYYHSVPSGFPGKSEINKICPKCNKNIGTETTWLFNTQIVKREGYLRIFKDEEEIKKLKKNENLKNKLDEINYMTLKELKEKYVDKIEKGGIYSSDKNIFKSDEKIIRNLSKVSFRLLNFILFSNLYFSKLIIDTKDFDDFVDGCLPKTMKWEELLSECWNILKNELSKVNIDSFEEFMNYIFPEIFTILNEHNKLENYNDLIEFENILESKIQELIKDFQNKDNQNEIKDEDDEHKKNAINLLKEKYDDYDTTEFPFYKYFYFSDYLNENYLYEKLSHIGEQQYPLLQLYIKDKIQTTDENKYSPANFILFNNVLNLINQAYFNNISKAQAEKDILKNDDIYKKNKKQFEKFIDFYNSLEFNNKLSVDNPLSDFFIDDSNEFGKTYIEIYRTFIKQYNEIIENLLDLKIEKGIFDNNCKKRISISEITQNEIFNLNLLNKTSFIKILFESSYRKILDITPINYKLYKEYIINYDLIEETLTEILLKNKRVLNEEIAPFVYNNELFSNQTTNIVTLLKIKYKTKITLKDKADIYRFCNDNKQESLHKNIIIDFIKLIKFLNSKDEKSEIKDEEKIYKVIKDNLKDETKDIIKLFDNKEDFTVGKIPEIFDYYLKVIFEGINLVNTDIKKYQKALDKESKEYIKNYIKDKKNIISAKDFATAIRLFITLVLFLEDDENKNNKIKPNDNNIIKYLLSEDLWDEKVYIDDKFNENLNGIKSKNLKINQIYYIYENLGKDIEKNFFEDAKQKIEEENKNNNPSDDNPSEDDDDDDNQDVGYDDYAQREY